MARKCALCAWWRLVCARVLCQSSRMAAESPRLVACGIRKRERIAAETDDRRNSQAQCLRAVGRQRAELRGRRRGRLESVNEIRASLAVVVTKMGPELARMQNPDKQYGYHDTERKGDSAAGSQRRPRSTRGCCQSWQVSVVVGCCTGQ
jgi:hypothetical protein